jgi:glyoxylase-like metal-dependent hydrolase (beta-lactamase superfamily II)
MSSEMHITFINVGQGDSTLIHLPSNSLARESAVLIDCPSSKSQVVLDLLEKQKVEPLALVIVTHSDDDHCGGISDILSNFATMGTIGQVAYIPDSPTSGYRKGIGRGYKRFARLTLDLEQKGKLIWWRPNLDTKRFGETIIRFLHPDERDIWLGLVEKDRNSVSQVVSVALLCHLAILHILAKSERAC